MHDSLDSPVAPQSRHTSTVTMDTIKALGLRLDSVVQSVKNNVFKPSGLKTPPSFNLSQLAALCHKSSDQMSRLVGKEANRAGQETEEPSGTDKKRTFTLEDARQWVRKVGPARGRPEGHNGQVLTIANFKGGVGKTVISISIAQGLALKGYKVLCIDLDPQGSLTTMFGITPLDLGPTDTILPLVLPKNVEHATDTIQGAIRSTYFDGIDLVPANHTIQAGEFYLPVRQLNSHDPRSPDHGFEFFNILSNALDLGIRQEYDYIICDTPPSLSYMVMMAIWASDALLLPLPAEGLDFQSSAQFWTMLSELSTGMGGRVPKEFAWMGAVPSQIDHTKMHTKEILKWMQLGYQEMLMTTEIPRTAAVGVGGVRMETVYDTSKYVGAQKTLLRARTAYDKLVDEVDFLSRRNFWHEQV